MSELSTLHIVLLFVWFFSGVPVVDGSSVHDPSSEPKSAAGRSSKGSSKKAKASESSSPKEPESPLDDDDLSDVEGKKRDPEKGGKGSGGGKKKRYRLEEKWTNCGWDYKKGDLS